MSIILNLSRSLAFRSGIRDKRVYSVLQRHYSKAYDYDGKTKIDIFNTQLEGGLMITGYSPYGFRLNTNMTAIGPIAIFSRWDSSSYFRYFRNCITFFLFLVQFSQIKTVQYCLGMYVIWRM